MSINRAFEVGAIVMLPNPLGGVHASSSPIPTLQGAASANSAGSLVQNASDVITIHATTGITYYVSESVHRIWVTAARLVGNNILNLVHPDTVQMKNFFCWSSQESLPCSIAFPAW